MGVGLRHRSIHTEQRVEVETKLSYPGQTPRCGSGWGSAGQCHTSPHSGWGTPAPEPVQARGRVDTGQEQGEVYIGLVCACHRMCK